jgi:hypothetical protein
MTNYIVKTHRKKTVYSKPHLFILNKGLNSGKPQKEPFANSFVLIFQNEEDCENMYWVAFSLWKSKFWQQFLIGSVIPFIRLQEFKKELFARVTDIYEDYEQHKKDIQALRLLESKEKQFHENINLINDLRRTILYRYCKR